MFIIRDKRSFGLAMCAEKTHILPMSRTHPITPSLSKAARALLGLTQDRMAAQIDISISTIRRFESGRGLDMTEDNRAKLIAFYCEKGLEFITQDGEIIGLQHRQYHNEEISHDPDPGEPRDPDPVTAAEAG